MHCRTMSTARRTVATATVANRQRVLLTPWDPASVDHAVERGLPLALRGPRSSADNARAACAGPCADIVQDRGVEPLVPSGLTRPSGFSISTITMPSTSGSRRDVIDGRQASRTPRGTRAGDRGSSPPD